MSLQNPEILAFDLDLQQGSPVVTEAWLCLNHPEVFENQELDPYYTSTRRRGGSST
jgi:hypothetical protein